MTRNVEGLELLHIKTYSYESHRKKLFRQNMTFLISFIMLIINIIIQTSKLNLNTLFDKELFLISIGIIFFDLIIYIPIYFINCSFINSLKMKKSLLFLYTIKKYERILGSIFYIYYFFLIMPDETRNSGFSGWVDFVRDNYLISISLFATSIVLLIMNYNKYLKYIKKDILDSVEIIEVYETDKETKNVKVKTYDNPTNKASKLFYIIKLFIILSIIVAAFVVFAICMLKLWLQDK